MADHDEPTQGSSGGGDATKYDRIRRAVGLWLGPLAALLLMVLPLSGLEVPARRLAAVIAWVVVWWITEAVPLPVTALLGPALAAALGVISPKDAFSPFGDPVIFLFLGGFLLAQGMTIHGLDRRIALVILASRWVGGRPVRVLAGFALLAAALSMWLSNTATTAMLYPIAMGVLGATPALKAGGSRHRTWATGLLLVCAYGSSIGGIGTPVGTPPNLIAMGQLARLAGVRVTFLQWMGLALPVLGAMLGFALLYLRLVFPAPRGVKLDVASLRAQRHALDRLTPGERNVLVAFIVAVAGWIGPGTLAALLGPDSDTARALTAALPESVVALLAASLLFVLPLDRKTRRPTLAWTHARDIDWGTLMLFGGGLSLGSAMFNTGLAASLGRALVDSSGAHSLTALTVLFSIIAVFMTEVTSNTASATMLVPLAIAAAQSAGVDPMPPALGCALGCSMAFMLPVATPPNAIIYGSGKVPLPAMLKAGWWLNVAACVVIPAVLLLSNWLRGG